MYGAEYEQVGGPLNDQDVPCAVCVSTLTSMVMMIPARDECYQGWEKQYHGHLSSGHYGHHATQYVCLDAHPEIRPGSLSANTNGRLFYSVRAACLNLPCSIHEYDASRPLSCVVCAK